MTWLLWLLPALPAAAGLVLVGCGLPHRSRLARFAAPAAVAVAAVTLLAACLVAAARPAVSAPLLAGLPARLSVDGLSALMVITVAAVTLLVLAYAAAELDRGQARGRFFGLMLVFSAGMLLTVTAATLPVLLAGWEVMGAASYALIGFWWREPRRVGSALTAFLTTRLADLGLYVAAGAALAGTHGGSLAALATATPGWRQVAAAGILLAALGKSAQLPFSFWLSRAMDGPSPVSALLHSATMVAAGAYLLLRTAPLLHATGWAGPTAAWIGAATAVLLGVVALAQTDLKQLLAASTCAQVGFMVLAAGTGATAGGTIQLVAHAATKSLLFLAAGVWLSALGTKRLSALRGAARRWRRVGIPFAVGAAGLAGLPPLGLWASKDAALSAAAQQMPALYVAGLLGAALSAAYSVRILVLLWAPAPPDVERGYDTEQPGTRRVTTAMVAPLMVLAVSAAGLVLLGLPPTYGRLAGTLGAPADVQATGLLVSAVLAVVVGSASAVLVLGRARMLPLPARAVRVATGWLGLERAAHVLVVGPTLQAAAACAWFDGRILDGTVTAVSRGAARAARAGSSVGEVGVQDAVAGVVGASRRLGTLARRPQTGQLHQYYAQAAVALAAGVLLLLVVR